MPSKTRNAMIYMYESTTADTERTTNNHIVTSKMYEPEREPPSLNSIRASYEDYCMCRVGMFYHTITDGCAERDIVR